MAVSVSKFGYLECCKRTFPRPFVTERLKTYSFFEGGTESEAESAAPWIENYFQSNTGTFRSITDLNQGSPVNGEKLITQVKKGFRRISVPFTFEGSYMIIEYQRYNQFNDGNTQSVSIDEVTWSGPGTGPPTDPSWHSPYFAMDTPFSDESQGDVFVHQQVRILKYKPYTSANWIKISNPV